MFFKKAIKDSNNIFKLEEAEDVVLRVACGPGTSALMLEVKVGWET